MGNRVWPRSVFVACAAALLLAACRADEPAGDAASVLTPTPTTVAADPSPTAAPLAEAARAYLDEALTHIERNALYRDRVDWPATRADAFRQAAGAQTPAETYGAIRLALSRLGDRHSFLQEPAQVQQSATGTGSGTPAGRRLDGGIGYISLPQAVGPAPGYAETAQRLIREIDAEPVCGWVVDLRQNPGGNMWPMLAGIGPVLGEGEVGAFDNGRGTRSVWSYRDGASLNGGAANARVAEPYTLKRPNPPVAVLTSARTASSGEATAVAFRSRPDTRSFGGSTAGVPTANAGKRMPDGAMILLTVSRMADRTGQAYEASLEPDQSFGPAEVQSDAPLDAAAAWLRGHPACRQ